MDSVHVPTSIALDHLCYPHCGMQNIMLSQNAMHQLQVAVKLLPFGDGQRDRERLQREVMLLIHAARYSSHVVRVRGLTVRDNSLAIVMDKYPHSLAQHVGAAGVCRHAEAIQVETPPGWMYTRGCRHKAQTDRTGV